MLARTIVKHRHTDIQRQARFRVKAHDRADLTGQLRRTGVPKARNRQQRLRERRLKRCAFNLAIQRLDVDSQCLNAPRILQDHPTHDFDIGCKAGGPLPALNQARVFLTHRRSR